jgi:hypothetical protein
MHFHTISSFLGNRNVAGIALSPRGKNGLSEMWCDANGCV